MVLKLLGVSGSLLGILGLDEATFRSICVVEEGRVHQQRRQQEHQKERQHPRRVRRVAKPRSDDRCAQGRGDAPGQDQEVRKGRYLGCDREHDARPSPGQQRANGGTGVPLPVPREYGCSQQHHDSAPDSRPGGKDETGQQGNTTRMPGLKRRV